MVAHLELYSTVLHLVGLTLEQIFIPETAPLIGIKVVIGDNSTSHFSSVIIKAYL